MNLLDKENPDEWSTKHVEDMNLLDKNPDGWSTEFVPKMFESAEEEEYDPTKQMFLWEKYEYDTKFNTRNMFKLEDMVDRFSTELCSRFNGD